MHQPTKPREFCAATHRAVVADAFEWEALPSFVGILPGHVLSDLAATHAMQRQAPGSIARVETIREILDAEAFRHFFDPARD